MNATTLLLMLLLLACPLSMLFMHRGGGHSHGSRDDAMRHTSGTAGDPPAPDHDHDRCGHGMQKDGSAQEHVKSGTAA